MRPARGLLVVGVALLVSWTAAALDTPPAAVAVTQSAPAVPRIAAADVGLTAIQGLDGLSVFVRSIASARPAPGVKVRLVARNGASLAEIETDAAGAARFSAGLLRGKGGRAAKAVHVAPPGGGTRILELAKAPLDLVDRGAGGRDVPGSVDVFLYGDRGAYRPGDTAHVVALVRDDMARAVAVPSLTVKLLRPDGVEAWRTTAKPGALGVQAFALPFSAGAQGGRWTVQAHVDPDAPPVGALHLLVEDEAPPSLAVTLSAAAPQLWLGEPADLALAADDLLGAPVAGLPVEGEAVIMADDAPFPDRPGYRFGLADQTVEPHRIALPHTRTDATGRAGLRVDLQSVPQTTLPLKAVIRADAFEPGGRPVRAALTLPVRQRTTLVGLHPRFGEAGAAAGDDAVFDVVVLDADGKATAGSLDYVVYRDESTYRWFRRNGAWEHEIQVADTAIAKGSLTVGAEAPAELSQWVEAGRYRLHVTDRQSGAATSLRFHAGWFVAPSAPRRPDSLELVADRATYRPGDIARLHVKPPFDGEVLLAVVNERLVDTRDAYVPATGATIEIPVRESWGTGAYVLATAFRPGGGEGGPGRAVGLAWLGLDSRPHTFNLALEAPGEVRPRGPVEIKVAVDGVEAGRPAFVTVAAVDERVARRPGFDLPDPADHFHGKRRLGVWVRDLYGGLVEGRTAAAFPGGTGDGGSEPAAWGGWPVEGPVAALFSGVVRLDERGEARIPFAIPDFDGRLRLTAVAFDAHRIGVAESVLTVRDPLAARVSLPRFLTAGDDGRLALTVENVRSPAGDVTASLRTEGAVALDGDGRLQTTLDKGAAAGAVFALKGTMAGTGTVLLDLAGPDGFKMERRWTVAVRPAQSPVTRRSAKRLRPGGRAAYDVSALEGLVSGTGELLLSFSPRPDLDGAGLLRALDRDPRPGLESTVNRALAMLHVADGATVWAGLAMAAGQRAGIAAAIERLSELQRPDGGFGPWRPGDEADPWLSAYAVDFLVRARAKDHAVPESTYAAGLRWLAERVRQGERAKGPDLAALAYAHYVLAAARVGNAAETRGFAETAADRLPGALAAAQVAAALARRGDGEAARLMFARAVQKAGGGSTARDHGSAMRDLAGLVVLAAETEPLLKGLGRDVGGRSLGQLLEDLAARQAKAETLSQQEQAWLLMAVAASRKGPGRMTLAVDGWKGAPQAEPLYLRPTDAQLALGLTYENAGKGSIWHTATAIGIPVAEAPATAEGFSLRRTFYTFDGRPADLGAVRRNERLVVVLEGEAPADGEGPARLFDPLGGGLAAESALPAGSPWVAEAAWLPGLSPVHHAGFENGRFVAVLDVNRRNRDFAVAYLVRAVTPGTYRLPGAEIEDSLRPRLRARTAGGLLTVLPVD